MRNIFTKTKTVWFSILIVIALVFISNKKYQYPSEYEINQRIKYLNHVIAQPLDKQSEILLLGDVNFEWILFTYAYSTYALFNLVEKDSSYSETYVPIIKVAIEKTLQEPIYSPYNIDSEKLFSDSIPDYSVLYLGHLNLMLGKYRQISSDTSYNSLHDRISKSLFNRYLDSPFLNLESYPYSIWIPDNSVAITSLQLHSKLTGSNYNSVVDKWLNSLKENYIDQDTGVLFSMINPQNGLPFEEPRGSMLGWSIMFISSIDPSFANELYLNYESAFSTNLGILQLFKERHNDANTNFGDIDSGPIFFGYSIPANEFAFANALFANDLKTAKRIERLINLGTSKDYSETGLRYKSRFIDFQISPMAEALVLFSHTNHSY